jgi:hypothetical protein
MKISELFEATKKLPFDPFLLSYFYADYDQEALTSFDQDFNAATAMWLDDNGYKNLRACVMRGDAIKVSHRVMATKRLLANRKWNILDATYSNFNDVEDDDEFECLLFQQAAKPFNDPEFKSFEHSNLTSVPVGLVKVMHALNLSDNNFASNPQFENLPDHCDILNLKNCKITSLSGFGNKKRSFFNLDISGNPIKSNILSLVQCEFINDITYENIPRDAEKAIEIVQEYLKSHNVLACQRALMKANLLDFAKL